VTNSMGEGENGILRLDFDRRRNRGQVPHPEGHGLKRAVSVRRVMRMRCKRGLLTRAIYGRDAMLRSYVGYAQKRRIRRQKLLALYSIARSDAPILSDAKWRPVACQKCSGVAPLVTQGARRTVLGILEARNSGTDAGEWFRRVRRAMTAPISRALRPQLSRVIT
jgi:hypothetical protein